jgi:hypothetical protein
MMNDDDTLEDIGYDDDDNNNRDDPRTIDIKAQRKLFRVYRWFFWSLWGYTTVTSAIAISIYNDNNFKDWFAITFLSNMSSILLIILARSKSCGRGDFIPKVMWKTMRWISLIVAIISLVSWFVTLWIMIAAPDVHIDDQSNTIENKETVFYNSLITNQISLFIGTAAIGFMTYPIFCFI